MPWQGQPPHLPGRHSGLDPPDATHRGARHQDGAAVLPAGLLRAGLSGPRRLRNHSGAGLFPRGHADPRAPGVPPTHRHPGRNRPGWPKLLTQIDLDGRMFASTVIGTFFMMPGCFAELIGVICRRHLPREGCHWLTEPKKGGGVFSQFAPARSGISKSISVPLPPALQRFEHRRRNYLIELRLRIDQLFPQPMESLLVHALWLA
jgi:hypothetical protein